MHFAPSETADLDGKSVLVMRRKRDLILEQNWLHASAGTADRKTGVFFRGNSWQELKMQSKVDIK
jgi:hypothetical protein